jgi:hypothetical protein
VIAQINVENVSLDNLNLAETYSLDKISTLLLHIIRDNHSYSQTLSMLQTIDPSEVKKYLTTSRLSRLSDDH